MILDFHTTNNFLKEKILKGDPFFALRIDNTAGYVIECLLKGEYPDINFFNERSLVEAGVVPTTLEYAFNSLYPNTIEVMKRADLLGFVDVANTLHSKKEFLSNFQDIPIYSGPPMLVNDPAALVNVSGYYECTDPWTKYLKNKKVLVVSTHRESILHQWDRIDKVWGSNKELVVPFELVDCIRSPYHPLFDDRQYPGCESWEDTVNFIKEQITKYDFDVLLTGATTSSPFYAEHAKSLGKIGIQTGGTIQLFFGILGYRWTKVEGYKNWHKMYNENWIYPLQIDEAQKRKQYMQLETNFAYW